MQTQRFIQKMRDATEIAVNRWIPDNENEIKAVVILSHGMQEHALRYDRIGCIFAENGYVFNAHDHRGHGKTSQIAEANGTGLYGFLAEKKGYEVVTEDLHEVINKVKADFPGRKYVLLGHSFGSFVAQNFIEMYGSELDGCIITGSSGRQITAPAAKLISGIAKLFGKKRKSELIQNIAFAGNNAHIKNPKTKLDWLSLNPDNVTMYMNDSWCGGVATVSFFNDLASLLCKIHKKKNIAKVPADLPVLMGAGDEDPIGKYGTTLEKLKNEYLANGVKNVQLHLYKGDRHEIFFEKDSDMIIDDLLNWLNTNIAVK